MPELDVSSVILDPMFCEALAIYRRVQTISNKGVTVVTQTQVRPVPYGVVLPMEDSPLLRTPEYQNLPQQLEVHTQYRLRSASQNAAGTEQYQPDYILWNGDWFLVNKISNFSRFGRGFICAYCSSTDPIDVEPAA